MSLGDFWKTSHQKERAKLSLLAKYIYGFFCHARDDKSDIRVALHNNSWRDENAFTVLLEIPEADEQNNSYPPNITRHVVATMLLDGRLQLSAYHHGRQIADKRTILDIKKDTAESLYDLIIKRIVNDTTGMFDIDTLDIIRGVERRQQIFQSAQEMTQRLNLG